jgi:hypothetical protein
MSTYRLVSGVVEHVGLDIDGLASDLVGPASVVANAANNSTDVTTGHVDGLSVVQRLDGGKKIGVLLANVGELVHELTSLMGSNLLPCRLEGLAGRGYGKVDILLTRLAHRGDDLLSGRVDDVELSLVNTLDPFVVDEPVIDVSKTFTRSLDRA